MLYTSDLEDPRTVVRPSRPTLTYPFKPNMSLWCCMHCGASTAARQQSAASTQHPAGTHLCVVVVADAPLKGHVFLGDVAIGSHVARVVNGVMAEEAGEGVHVEEIGEARLANRGSEIAAAVQAAGRGRPRQLVVRTARGEQTVRAYTEAYRDC